MRCSGLVNVPSGVAFICRPRRERLPSGSYSDRPGPLCCSRSGRSLLGRRKPLRLDPSVRLRSRERQVSAHLAHSRLSWRRSPYPIDSGPSAAEAGTGARAPFRPLSLRAGIGSCPPYPTSTTSPKTRRMGVEKVVEHATCYWIVLGTRRQDNLTESPSCPAVLKMSGIFGGARHD